MTRIQHSSDLRTGPSQPGGAPRAARMGRSRRFGMAVGGAVSLALSAPAAWAETLTDTLIDAYRHSHLLDQNRALLRAADEDVAQAVASLRPVLNFAASATRSFPLAPTAIDVINAAVELQASITLYDGGDNQLAIDQTKETVLATREALVAVEQSVLLSAVQAYTDVQSAKQLVALRQSNTRLITEQLRAARDRFEVGEITRTEVAAAEARLAAANSSYAAAEGQLEYAREAYKLAVGHAPGTLADAPPTPDIPNTLDEAKKIATRTHPAIRQAQREVTVTELGVLRAQAAMKPSVNANASVAMDKYGDRSGAFGLSLNQPIYAGGALSSAVRQARAQRDANRANLLQTVHEVEQSAGNAWATLAVAIAQLEATDRQISAAQIAFNGIREEASLGARTTLDVLDAEQDLLDARVDRVDAVAAQYVAIYSLLSAMGLLTVDHLKLGIQTYDPSAYYNAVKNAPAGLSQQGRKLDAVLERLGKR